MSKNNSLSSLGVPRYKEEIQKIQSNYLAPYAVKVPKEGSRRDTEYDKITTETRGEFQRDRDRIIHSKAFRRLLYKTQVFVNHEGDHYRTRMTHSLEVSQISRGIARSLAVNEDLVEAIALGHDLGHTPFGHAVESLLAEKLKNEHGFFHNEQSVRIVDIVEERTVEDKKVNGLNLTAEVREGILKHNDDRTEGLYSSLNPKNPASLEGQIVSLVDTIAYVCHDLDDGLNAGLIDEKIKHGLLSVDEKKKLWERFGLAPETGVRAIIHKLVVNLVDSTWKVIETNNIDTFEKVVNYQETKDKTIKGNKIVRLGEYQEAFAELKKFVKEHIYKSSMASIMDVKARNFIDSIYESYWKNPEQLPPEKYSAFLNASKASEKKAETSDEYDGYVTTPARVLCDYISLMTDRYALETYEKLFNPHTRI